MKGKNLMETREKKVTFNRKRVTILSKGTRIEEEQERRGIARI